METASINHTAIEYNFSDAYWYYYDAEDFLSEATSREIGKITTATKSILLCLYALVVAFSLFGNIAICFAFKKKILQRTNTNLFILVVSLNDILQIMGEPFLVVSNIVLYSWPYAAFMCPLMVYVQIVTVTFRAFVLVAVSFDKYTAILKPTRPRFRKFLICAVTIILFVCAMLVSLPIAIYTEVSPLRFGGTDKAMCLELWDDPSAKFIYSIFIMLVQYFLPITTMGISYSRIILILHRHRIPGEPLAERDERVMKSKKKTVKMLILIFVCYAVVWLPVHIITIAGDLNWKIFDNGTIRIVWLGSQWLTVTSCCVNSIVYFWRNKNYRSFVIYLLRQIFGAGRNTYPVFKRRSRKSSSLNIGSQSLISFKQKLNTL